MREMNPNTLKTNVMLVTFFAKIFGKKLTGLVNSRSNF
jgi:hypothetical protein